MKKPSVLQQTLSSHKHGNKTYPKGTVDRLSIDPPFHSHKNDDNEI